MARREAELTTVVQEIHAKGDRALAYPTDLSDLDAVDRLGELLLRQHGKIDVLVNNAGRSIRRPVVESLERYHDFERCMLLNYYSPVRLTRALLPAMLEARDGHIVNSSTWGTLLPAPNFAAYNASKAALDAFATAMRVELKGRGVAVTQIHFPLVHTPMSAATKAFRNLPGLTPEQAGRWVVRAVRERPQVILDAKTRLISTLAWHLPRIAEIVARQIRV